MFLVSLNIGNFGFGSSQIFALFLVPHFSKVLDLVSAVRWDLLSDDVLEENLP